jgi:hypothetical protein
MNYDVFISHASEDKDKIVRALAVALQEAGLRVWYDEFALRVGDSLSQAIDRGLAEASHGIVVLSPMFFQKRWPRRELDGLVQRQTSQIETFRIIPILHDVTPDEVRAFSPILGDTFSILASKGLEQVVARVVEVLSPESLPTDSYRGPQTGMHVGSNQRALSACLGLVAKYLGISPDGVELTVRLLSEDLHCLRTVFSIRFGGQLWEGTQDIFLLVPPAISRVFSLSDTSTVNPRWNDQNLGRQRRIESFVSLPLHAPAGDKEIRGVTTIAFNQKNRFTKAHTEFFTELGAVISALVFADDEGRPTKR